MPPLSRIMIRAALINGWLGMTLAALLLINKGLPGVLPGNLWRWLPVHMNMLLVGWMVQLAMGVAYWIMPRLHLSERGRVQFAIAAGILLNIGVWVHGLAILLRGWIGWQAAGLILETSAVATFIFHVYPRIKTFTPSPVSRSKDS